MNFPPMELSRAHNTLSASERKRMRDRKAQKAAREKREVRIKALEDRVTYCERHHGAAWMQHMMAAMDTLQRENKMLRERHEHLRVVFSSWEQHESTLQRVRSYNQAPSQQLSSLPKVLSDQDDDVLPIRIHPSNTSQAGADPLPLRQPPTMPGNKRAGECSQGFFPPHSDPANLLTPGETACGSIPAWCLTPINEYGHVFPSIPVTCPWLAHSDLVAACPSLPSPLDLLHGTRRNFLADKISQVLRVRAMRDPERLANGWLIYVFSKWRVTPSLAAFTHIPSFLRPVLLQMQCGHPAALDLIIFPQIRINLIENWDKYDFQEVFDYMSCCQKVRWPWSEDILERDDQDNLCIRKEFFDVFMSESGWGLTPEFMKKYPGLLKGMDTDAVCFRVGSQIEIPVQNRSFSGKEEEAFGFSATS
ncbi:hypothetical protein BDV26DRAFT_262434 [Aspergillus bertholletiae]|uniref:BZIP domain-containing protein n=1 Tax=Aspergillus bertholletiae TaxID=1226010 RepID=A0A5N7B853_9EURO|nr:hypothetical protein BDV26DRAFT_262434 [Aspergillus bertholletiae]